MNIVGNISITSGATLTIYNSNLTFTNEPSSSSVYAYGINVSAGYSNGELIVRHGSLISQSSNTTASYFIAENYASTSRQVKVSNSTIDNPQNYLAPDVSRFTNGLFLQFDYLNYSTLISSNGFETYRVGQPWLNYSHSLFVSSSIGGTDNGNNTFTGETSYAGCMKQGKY